MNIDHFLDVEVATGGKPATAVAAAVQEQGFLPGRVYHVSVAHDDGCPCTSSHRALHHCTCEIVVLRFGRRTP